MKKIFESPAPGLELVEVDVGGPLRAEYLEYCASFGGMHDPSYTNPDDLAATGSGDAAFLVRDSGRKIRGAGGLMLEARFLETGKGRLRILHVDPALGAAAPDAYGALAIALRRAAADEGFKAIFFFLPENEACSIAIEAAEKCGFTIERHSWEMRRDLADLTDLAILADPPVSLLPGFRMERAVFPEDDPSKILGAPWLSAWCRIVNDAFAHLAGHTEMTPERCAEALKPELEYPGGRILLLNGTEPCGLALGIKSPESVDGRESEIGPIAVSPQWQGRGFGRALLRRAMAEAVAAGFAACVLSVNAENSQAVALYLSEGFVPTAHFLCWTIPVSDGHGGPLR